MSEQLEILARADSSLGLGKHLSEDIWWGGEGRVRRSTTVQLRLEDRKDS